MTAGTESRFAVYDGRDRLGAVIQRVGGFDVFDPTGVHLGTFPNVKAAVAAVNASLLCSCVCDANARRDGSP